MKWFHIQVTKHEIVHANYFINQTFLNTIYNKFKTGTIKSYLLKCWHSLAIQEAQS